MEGDKIKAYVHFVGRAIVFKERGVDLLKKFIEELDEYGKIEQEPKLEGKRMTLLMSPKPGIVKKPKVEESENKAKSNKSVADTEAKPNKKPVADLEIKSTPIIIEEIDGEIAEV